MKRIITLFFLIASSSVYAVEKVYLPEEFLGSKICNSFVMANDVTKKIEVLVNERYIEVASEASTSRKIVEYLNNNKDKLTCLNVSPGKSGRHNIIKRAISEEDMIQLVIYDYFFKLSKEAGLKIDFNAVEKIDGEFETPLDYLLKEIARYEVGSSKYKELNKLKIIMVRGYGAKQFKDLPDAVKKKYIDIDIKINMPYQLTTKKGSGTAWKKIQMLSVPKGEFTTTARRELAPGYEINVSAFKMSKTEVTYGLWNACVKDGGCSERKPSHKEEKLTPDSAVYNVTIIKPDMNLSLG